MRTFRWLVGTLSIATGVVTLGTATTGCSSTSSASAPTVERVIGTYKAGSAGLIGEVNFDSDGTHYSMKRAVCAGSENACVEHGTFVLSPTYDSIAFTNAVDGTTSTLPFQASHSEPVASTSSASLHVLGVGLGGGTTTGSGGGSTLGGGNGSGSGGVSLTGDAGITICLGGSQIKIGSSGISLVISFSLGGQTFSATINIGGCGDGGAGSGSGGAGSGSGSSGGGGGGGSGGGGGGGSGGGSSDAGAGGGSGGGGSSDGGGGGADGGGFDSGADAAAPLSTYYIPQVVNNGGPVLASPQIVTITYPGDSNQATYEGFGDAIGASSFWSTTTSQYGIGAATSGSSNHVHLTAPPPAAMADTDLEAFVQAQAGSTSSGWPTPNANVIYEIYLPSSVNLTVSGGAACGSATTGYIGGYHASTTVGSTTIAYAIVTNCQNQGVTVDSILQASSHELVEAATDPVGTNPAFIGFGDAYLAWDIFQNFQDEIGDACEFYPEAETTDPLGTSQSYGVQRMWSNQGATAGTALCVPASTGSTPYYNVNPMSLQTVSVTSPTNDWKYANPQTIQTYGYNIPAGQSATFQVQYWSSGTTGNWTLSGAEGIPQVISGNNPTSGHLTVTIDKTSGNNGTTANVTVAVSSADTPNYEILTLQSTQGSEIHYMPILISNNN